MPVWKAAAFGAGLFAIVGAWFDPAAGISGRQMYEIYTVEHLPLQLKSLGFHWAYAFWIAPALLIAPYVRGRGAWLANVTAFVGFAGMTTLPGLLFVDWYDSAIGQMYGVDAIERVNEHMGATMWGIPVFTLPGIAGLAFALPLAALALWRAGLVRWWAPVSVIAAFQRADYAAALLHFQSARDAGLDSAAVHYNLADKLAQLPGREADAIRHFRAATQSQPGFAAAHFRLAQLLERQPGAKRAACSAFPSR